MDLAARLKELVITRYGEGAEEVAEGLRVTIFRAMGGEDDEPLEKALADLEAIMAAKRQLYEADQRDPLPPEPVVEYDAATAAAWDRQQNPITQWGIESVNWGNFWDRPDKIEDWLIEPLVPAGRQVALWSPAKQGKSLLALDAAVALATGNKILGRPALAEPVPVVYIDQEMTPDDLQERLEDLGYDRTTDLSNFHYYQLQGMPPMDSEDGGVLVDAMVRQSGAKLCVLDTMARVVEGDENTADTYRSFYRHTGRRLKAADCALLRLDHSGKNMAQGQRGSSAKVDDVDVVFKLMFNEETQEVSLTCTHSRVSWAYAHHNLRRELSPLRHTLAAVACSPQMCRVLDDLIRIGFPPDGTSRMAQEALKRSGKGHRRADVQRTIKHYWPPRARPQDT